MQSVEIIVVTFPDSRRAPLRKHEPPETSHNQQQTSYRFLCNIFASAAHVRGAVDRNRDGIR